MRRLLPLAAFLALSCPAFAGVVVCIGSSSELVAALTAAQSDLNGRQLRIRSGVYPVTSTAGFLATVSSAPNAELWISGGWNADCSLRSNRAADTLLQGDATGPVLTVRHRQVSPFDEVPAFFLANLTITGGLSPAGSGSLDLRPIGGTLFGGWVQLANLIVTGNEGGAAIYAAPNGRIDVFGSRIDGNATAGSGAVYISNTNELLFANNTVVDNTAGALPTSAGLFLKGPAGPFAGGAIVNNIFWGNAGADVKVNNAAPPYSRNDAGTVVGPVSGTGNVSVDPGFVDAANGDYRLADASPLVDYGGASSQLPAFDLDGVPRPTAVTWDLGAYENRRLFADGFGNGTTSRWSASVP